MPASYSYNTDHRFNEDTRRFVPEGNTCIFCMTDDHGITIDSIPYFPLYKTHDYKVYRIHVSERYDWVEIGLHRCTACQKIHAIRKNEDGGTVIAMLIGVGCLIAGVAFGGATGALIGLATGVIVGLAVNRYMGEDINKKDVSFILREAAEANAIVRAMIRDGWSLNKPES